MNRQRCKLTLFDCGGALADNIAGCRSAAPASASVIAMCSASSQLFAPSLPCSLQLLQSVDVRQQDMLQAGLGDRCYCR